MTCKRCGKRAYYETLQLCGRCVHATFRGDEKPREFKPTDKYRHLLCAETRQRLEDLERTVQAPGGSELESAACRSLTNGPTHQAPKAHDRPGVGRSASATFKEVL